MAGLQHPLIRGGTILAIYEKHSPFIVYLARYSSAIRPLLLCNKLQRAKHIAAAPNDCAPPQAPCVWSTCAQSYRANACRVGGGRRRAFGSLPTISPLLARY